MAPGFKRMPEYDGKVFREKKKINDKKKKSRGQEIFDAIARITFKLTLIIMVLAVVAVYAVYATCMTVAYGPSESTRDMLVLSALQASATKWVPGIFLGDSEVQRILENSQRVTPEEVDFSDIQKPSETDEEGNTEQPRDEWEGNEDGIQYYPVSKKTFRAYVMIIRDPSKVYVGVSTTNFASSTRGARIYDVAKRDGAIAAINAGEFADSGGVGSGETPMGITYSQGELVWNDSLRRTFIGFDNENRLIVKETMTKAEAEQLGIRDGVSFQTGNVLIETTDGSTMAYYSEENVGVAQRTAIGQRADGAVIFIVTDGRTASSLGATRDDIINLMLEYGAVTAGMLDGGSSAMMYYANYIEKYNIDVNTLDQYQKLGLVNKYKAFTTPRWLPTFIMVKG